MDYGCIVRGGGGKRNALHLERLPNHAMRIFHLYTIYVIETNAAIFKQQKTVREITL